MLVQCWFMEAAHLRSNHSRYAKKN